MFKHRPGRTVPQTDDTYFTLEGQVTIPRIDTQWVVTEFGSVDLKGKSSPERAKALIELAHREFRSGLYGAAREQHLL